MALSFLQATSSTTDTNAYTFATQNLGTEDPNRYIIVTINARVGGVTALSISSVTIAGVTATVVSEVNQATNSDIAAIAIASVPTGATGSVVVTFNQTMSRCAIGMYRATMLSPTPTATQTSTAADPTANVFVPDNGFIIGTATFGASATTTWTGITEDYDNIIESNTNVTGASLAFATGQTVAVTANSSSATNPVGVFMSWSQNLSGHFFRMF